MMKLIWENYRIEMSAFFSYDDDVRFFHEKRQKINHQFHKKNSLYDTRTDI